jgi:hypothetical protein
MTLQRRIYESRIQNLPEESKAGAGNASASNLTMSDGVAGLGGDSSPVTPGPGGKENRLTPDSMKYWDAQKGKFIESDKLVAWPVLALADSIGFSKEALTNIRDNLGGLEQNQDVVRIVMNKIGGDMINLLDNVGLEKTLSILKIPIMRSLPPGFDPFAPGFHPTSPKPPVRHKAPPLLPPGWKPRFPQRNSGSPSGHDPWLDPDHWRPQRDQAPDGSQAPDENPGWPPPDMLPGYKEPGENETQGSQAPITTTHSDNSISIAIPKIGVFIVKPDGSSAFVAPGGWPYQTSPKPKKRPTRKPGDFGYHRPKRKPGQGLHGYGI